MKKLLTTSANIAAFSLALGLAGAAHAVDPGFPAPVGDPSVVPAGAKLDRVFDGGCILTEGVAAGHDGMVYFSDITFTKFCKDASGKFAQAGNIWKHNPKDAEPTHYRRASGQFTGKKVRTD